MLVVRRWKWTLQIVRYCALRRRSFSAVTQAATYDHCHRTCVSNASHVLRLSCVVLTQSEWFLIRVYKEHIKVIFVKRNLVKFSFLQFYNFLCEIQGRITTRFGDMVCQGNLVFVFVCVFVCLGVSVGSSVIDLCTSPTSTQWNAV